MSIYSLIFSMDTSVPSNTNKTISKRGSIGQFTLRLHDLLDFATQNGHPSISWIHNGSAFMINDSKKLVELLPRFFSQTKYRR